MLLGKDGDYAGNANDFVNLIGQFGRLIGNDIGGFGNLTLPMSDPKSDRIDSRRPESQ